MKNLIPTIKHAEVGTAEGGFIPIRFAIKIMLKTLIDITFYRF